MGNNGVRYFLFDTDIYKNEDFADVVEKYGSFAKLLYFDLLIRIYGKNGYYIEWNNDSVPKFAKRMGYPEGSIEEIKECVQDLVDGGMFCKEKFYSCNILTSNDIQVKWRRYKVKCHCKYTINPEYWIDIDDLEAGEIEGVDTATECPFRQMMNNWK